MNNKEKRNEILMDMIPPAIMVGMVLFVLWYFKT